MIERSNSYNKDITDLAATQNILASPKATSNPKIRKREEEEEHESDLPTNNKVFNVGQRLLNGPGKKWNYPDTAQLMVAYARVNNHPKTPNGGLQWELVKDLLPENKTHQQCSHKITQLKKNSQRFADLLAIATNSAIPSSSSSSSSSSQTIQPQSDKPTRNQKWTSRENGIILKAIEEGKTWEDLIASDFPNRNERALKTHFRDLKMFPQLETTSERGEWTDAEKQALYTYLEKNRNPITGVPDWSKLRDEELLKNRTLESIKCMVKRISPKSVPALPQATLLSPANETMTSSSNSSGITSLTPISVSSSSSSSSIETHEEQPQRNIAIRYEPLTAQPDDILKAKDIRDITDIVATQSTLVSPKATSNPKIRKREEEEDKHESDLPTNNKVFNVGQRLLNAPGKRWTDPATAQLMVAYARADNLPKNIKGGIQWQLVKDLLPEKTTYQQCSHKIAQLKKNPQRFADLLAIASNNAGPSSSSSSSSSQTTQPQSDKPIRNQPWTPRENGIILKAIEEGKTWEQLIVSDFPNRTETALQTHFRELKQFPKQPEAPPETAGWTNKDKKTLRSYIKKHTDPINGRVDWSEIESTGLLQNRKINSLRLKAKRIKIKADEPELIARASSPVPILPQTNPLSPVTEGTAPASNSLRIVSGLDKLFAAARSL